MYITSPITKNTAWEWGYVYSGQVNSSIMHMCIFYRKRKEREKRVAEKVAKQREEAEKRRHAQGQTVHEEQLEKLSQKKEKEKEERNRKNKEVCVWERISVKAI